VTDGDGGLSRRQILAAATTTGALGAVGIGSTGAVFSDSAEFTDNAMAAGTLDLEVCWASDGSVTCPDPAGSTLSLDIDSLSPGATGSGLVRLSLPETANPAWLWGRSTCPPATCGLAHATKLTLWWDRDGDGRKGPEDPVLTTGGVDLSGRSLCRVRELLASGFSVDPTPGDGTPDPVEPGSEHYLGVSWRVTDEYCPPSEASLPFEFRAIQRRHNPEPSNPWPAVDCGAACGEGCDTECLPASFVAFCLNRTGDISKYDMTHLSWTARTVTFELDRAIDNAVLYYGQPTFEIFEGPYRADTRYTIRRGDGEVLDETTAASTYDMAQADPCPEAVDGADACGIRYNFGAAEPWDCVCGPPGPDRQCGDRDG
jgi:hypothetical protein